MRLYADTSRPALPREPVGLILYAPDRVGEYDRLTASDAYGAYGRRWLANILGANAWGVSLIVGDGTTFPDCMQHQVANIVGSTNGSPRSWREPWWRAPIRSPLVASYRVW